MGNEQSNNAGEDRKLTKAEVKRLLDNQRRQYEETVQDVLTQALSPQHDTAPTTQPRNSLGSTGFERQRAPYNYVSNDLQNAIHQNTASPNLYPNLHEGNPGSSCSSPTVHTFNFENYVKKPPQSQQSASDYVFVNNSGNAERPRPSAPPEHSVSPQYSSQPQFSGQRKPRNRSASRSRYRADEDELNCPTCKKMFGLQIYQCSGGHSSCNDCKDLMRLCGICRSSITTMRNITLESYMAERKVPCPNKEDGCMLLLKMSDLDFHVRECPFNELQCPVGCIWKGKLKQLAVHFDAMHPEKRSADVGSEIVLQNIFNGCQRLFLVLLGAYNFLFRLKVSEADRKIYMTTQLIGTQMSASKWSYEIHVYNKNESRRKYTYSDICSSFQESVEDSFRDGKCLVLPLSYASTFVNNGVLTFKFYIKKTGQEKPRGNIRNQRGNGRKH